MRFAKAGRLLLSLFKNSFLSNPSLFLRISIHKDPNRFAGKYSGRGRLNFAGESTAGRGGLRPAYRNVREKIEIVACVAREVTNVLGFGRYGFACFPIRRGGA